MCILIISWYFFHTKIKYWFLGQGQIESDSRPIIAHALKWKRCTHTLTCTNLGSPAPLGLGAQRHRKLQGAQTMNYNFAQSYIIWKRNSTYFWHQCQNNFQCNTGIIASPLDIDWLLMPGGGLAIGVNTVERTSHIAWESLSSPPQQLVFNAFP